ncbi:iron complex transport system ATP-binding protein [Anaerosolibacter carboniphilus]|uniref:Iron complex transport system ATP-binding protein n=1 Tax=Anaerosolibacter carboniphilus TaxID=1417629 RepID=A0A841L575_9FIRM|nr:ABC transporter ATP-binding protein [Anaerosolibacter carboniphilus]MBB6217465.1 iron complex transport system ATP-binding protein [Anaerosolibacter carboniphilus]
MSLSSKDLTLGYGDYIVLKDINVTIPKNKITILVGSNGCGKSTLLKTMARLLKPMSGKVFLGNVNIFEKSSKEIAKELAILTQSPTAPSDLTVFNLIKQGRYPYQSWFSQWSKEDEKIVNYALEKTGLTHIQHKKISDLSGGQKQRVWIAMTLAQQTDTILLDEPTNHLDIKYKIEVLDLLRSLNQYEQRTIVIVLHDINLACRYADHIIAIKDGKVYGEGEPKEIITEGLIKDVFGINSKIIECPLFKTPMCITYQNLDMISC